MKIPSQTPKFRVIRVKDPIYRRQVEFVINASHERYRAHVKRTYDVELESEHWDVAGMLQTFESEKGSKITCVVWINRFEPAKYYTDMGVLCHEIQHLVFKVMRDKDVRASRESEEAWAYLYEFYINSFLEAYVHKKKRK